MCVCVCVCVCVAEARMNVFYTFVSSAKVFIYSVKRVRLQHQRCLSPAQNAFSNSNKHVRMQCDSYLDIRDDLITSDICLLVSPYYTYPNQRSQVYSKFVCLYFFLVTKYKHTKIVASDKRLCLLFGSWFRNPQKRTEYTGKEFLKRTSFQIMAGPVKGQKQGRDEKTQGHYPTKE